MPDLNCDRNVCYFCGLEEPTSPKTKGKKPRRLVELHHIVERNEGGGNHGENLVPCCSNCHSKIHLGLIEIFEWVNFAYCRKLKWKDDSGNQCGPKINQD